MKEHDERKGIRKDIRERMRDCGEYFDPNAIPPEDLIPYTDSLIFSLVMRDEEICRGVLQAILPEEDFGRSISKARRTHCSRMTMRSRKRSRNL